jgi:hypothetical protein
MDFSLVLQRARAARQKAVKWPHPTDKTLSDPKGIASNPFDVLTSF